MTEQITSPPPTEPPTEAPTETPAEAQSLDEMLAAALPEEEATEEATPAAPVTEAVPAQAAEPEVAPDAAPTPRSITVKTDHAEREVDFDALLKTDEGRKELKERYEKGYGFDRAVERTKTESYSQGRDQTVAWMRSKGFEPKQNPAAPGGWEIVPIVQAATPAAEASPPAATPDQSAERIALEEKANEGNVAAIRELARIDATAAAEKAAAEQFAKFDTWRDGLTRQAQEAQQRTKREHAEQVVTVDIRKAITARAKSFEGPTQDATLRIAQAVERDALTKARTDARTLEDVIAVVNQAADDLDARREHWLTQVANQPKPAAPAPTLDGTPPGVTDPASNRSPDYQDDADWDAAIAASAGGTP